LKHVVGISLGSPTRDHVATVNLMGHECKVERLGTDGDMHKMIEKIMEMDGRVDAFGLGGMDLYIYAVDRRYVIRDARRIVKAARKSPIVDGSGLKNTLERRAIEYLAEHTDIFAQPKKALLMSAMDRLGMAQALEKTGCIMTYGDFPFILNLAVPFHSLRSLALVARFIAPVVCQLPFTMLYPTGEKQHESKPRFPRYFQEADIIAGDFHFIRRYMPPELPGKIIITNTVTREDVRFLQERRVKTLVTTTPEMDGRSFGTNVMEALLVCLDGGSKELSEDRYNQMLSELNLTPRIVELQATGT
jgi:hypothetical protein